MNVEIIFFNFIILLILALIVFFLIRAFLKIYSTKKKLNQKDLSKVGFVVDTFHELVAKLKEKEKELEILRKKAEDRATTIEGYNENILQSVPSGVISFDDNLRITKVNQSAEKILDVHGENIIGKFHEEVLKKPITDMLNERKVIERAEISYTTTSGKRIWLGLTISPLKDTEGKTIGQILVFTDLTHLKSFEAQMELRNKLASLGEISAGIAHELRNPMAVIAGYTKLLYKKVDESLKTTVTAISKEISVMDRIITDFLSFAKPLELTISDIDLKSLIEKCISAIREERHDIKFCINFQEIPLIKGDEILLRQAFTNLIQNSVEAMPQGGNINITAVHSDFLEISISDSGHGISDNIIDKIFLPFFTTKEKGTGLGLAIVHKIIISHGGNISVTSNDKGTTFKIRFPIE